MKQKIGLFIENYVRNYREMKGARTEWGEPVVAFADSNDILFRNLKDIVNINHALPSDLLENAGTVISYFISFEKAGVMNNVGGTQVSKDWALAYIETNQLIADLNNALSEMLKKQGFKSAVAPPTHDFDEKNLVSCWSQKHVAYIAGLGNFGIHRMIITERGCCGRLGSLVTNVKIEPTKRKCEESCLYKVDKSCGLCVKKCIHGALKLDGLDKRACYEVCLETAAIYSSLGLADVCGKCIANVPCSFINPRRASK
ncbi:MAG: hypothetical protein QG670_598 [Thermoproteota archaeon]|nr:hypothetical protein [Thermoproteota archaeon]